MSPEALDYATWKADFLAYVESAANTVEKGDRFVQRVLRENYQLSEDDAVDATDCAGTGDSGADAIIIDDVADASQSPSAFVLQGKYGTAGEGLQVTSKFLIADDFIHKAPFGTINGPGLIVILLG